MPSNKPIRKIVLTGSSGYLGRTLIQYLRKVQPQVEIFGLDISPSSQDENQAPHRFQQLDVGSEEVATVLADYQPDTVIHYAFQVEPMRDQKRMRRTNLDGTKNVLSAIAVCQPARALIASSASAFGAWPDAQENVDTDIPKGRKEFAYSRHKAKQEEMVREFSDSNPNIRTSWIRPCIVGGGNMDNYILRALTLQPFIFSMGNDPRYQIVHEVDVARAVTTILAADGTGPFNVALRETTKLSSLAGINPRRVIRVPFWFGKMANWLAWNARMPNHELPPGFLHFSRYEWIALPNRLEQELGFEFEYSVEQTLDAIEKRFRRLYRGA